MGSERRSTTSCGERSGIHRLVFGGTRSVQYARFTPPSALSVREQLSSKLEGQGKSLPELVVSEAWGEHEAFIAAHAELIARHAASARPLGAHRAQSPDPRDSDGRSLRGSRPEKRCRHSTKSAEGKPSSRIRAKVWTAGIGLDKICARYSKRSLWDGHKAVVG